MTAKSPKTIGETPCTWKISGSRVAKVPLKKSITKVAIPAFLPKIRKVLVVPVLPDPCSLRLMLKNICPIQSPEGMEPSK